MSLARNLRKARRVAWNTQRILGDAAAAADGPTAYAKRRARAYTTRATMRGLGRAWRALGILSGSRR